MNISQRGILEIAEHAGIVHGPYKDSRGIWTFGIGHTAAAGDPDPATMPREDTRQWASARADVAMASAIRIFDADLDSYEERVRNAIKAPLSQHQFDALVSFDFNTGGIQRANLTRQINAGDYSGSGFMGWLKPPEIRGRRTAEKNLFVTGAYEANGDAIVLYDALGDGRIAFRRRVTGRELTEALGRGGSEVDRLRAKLARIQSIIEED